MKSKALNLSVIAALLVVLSASVGMAQNQESKTQPSSYTVIDLGTPLGAQVAITVGIQNNGLVSGYVIPPPFTAFQAFLWPATNLGTFGGPNSALLGGTSGFSETDNLDPLGQDFCETGTHLTCLALASPFGVPLPTLGGYNAAAFGNNNHGQVVGISQTDTLDPTCLVDGLPQPPFFEVQQSLPAIWQGGRIEALPLFAGDSHGHAYAINNRGQVVGSTGNNCLD